MLDFLIVIPARYKSSRLPGKPLIKLDGVPMLVRTFKQCIKYAPIEKIIVTDTLPLPANMQTDKVEVLSVAPLIAEAIRAVFEDTSVSEIFGGNNLV